MDTLAEIQERHTAVRDVERKLLDLQQVTCKICTLTHTDFIQDVKLIYIGIEKSFVC